MPHKSGQEVFPPFRLVAQFTDGARRTFDGLTWDQAYQSIVHACQEHGDMIWYDGVTDEHYEHGQYYQLVPQPEPIRLPFTFFDLADYHGPTDENGLPADLTGRPTVNPGNTKRNMPLWRTADIILKDLLLRSWDPHFGPVNGMPDTVICFFVLADELQVSLLVPPEDRDEFSRLMTAAKAKLLDAVGFRFDRWLYTPMHEATFRAMADELGRLIHDYESRGGGDVRHRFYNMLLCSDWDLPLLTSFDTEDP